MGHHVYLCQHVAILNLNTSKWVIFLPQCYLPSPIKSGHSLRPAMVRRRQRLHAEVPRCDPQDRPHLHAGPGRALPKEGEQHNPVLDTYALAITFMQGDQAAYPKPPVDIDVKVAF